MARLFYHKPKFAILDECTSAVTIDMEERFCAKVRAMGTSCITISHRPALVAFHDVVLSLDGEGGWSVHYKRLSFDLVILKFKIFIDIDMDQKIAYVKVLLIYRDETLADDENAMDISNALESNRQNDAMTVQRAFATNKKV